MTVRRMCELGRVSRAGLYRFEPQGEALDEDLDLRDEIQRIALKFPFYGRPRITEELKRHGWQANHKRVGRIMREDNLLCLRRRKFVVTTDSNHNLRIYPNLAGDMDVTGIDQLWRADITKWDYSMEKPRDLHHRNIEGPEARFTPGQIGESGGLLRQATFRNHQ